MDLVVTPTVVVPAAAIRATFVRSSGPGGQNVNKVSTKVELRVDPRAVRGLWSDALARLLHLARGRLDPEGRILVVSQATRDRARNLEDAKDKLVRLVAASLVAPRPRKKTHPSRAAVERRLANERKRAQRKAMRRGEE